MMGQAILRAMVAVTVFAGVGARADQIGAYECRGTTDATQLILVNVVDAELGFYTYDLSSGKVIVAGSGTRLPAAAGRSLCYGNFLDVTGNAIPKTVVSGIQIRFEEGAVTGVTVYTDAGVKARYAGCRKSS